MCQTSVSDMDDVDEVVPASHNKKPGKLIEPRKIRKPLMEKKRRARINQSLDELKRIVVDAHKFDGQDLSRVNKLEKADILEMTVKYLKRKAAPPAEVYMAGYKQCIEQVQELLAEQWTDERRQQSGQRMVEHLETCVHKLIVLPPPPPKIHLSLSSSFGDDASKKFGVTSMVGKTSSTFSSSDDDSVEELVIAKSTTTTPSSPTTNHSTEFQNTPPKSTWRPW